MAFHNVTALVVILVKASKMDMKVNLPWTNFPPQCIGKMERDIHPESYPKMIKVFL